MRQGSKPVLTGNDQRTNQEENSLKHKDIVGVSDCCRMQRDLCNKGRTVEPIRPEREASVNPVRCIESRGTCEPSNGRIGGRTGSVDYVEHNRQEANLGRYLEV